MFDFKSPGGAALPAFLEAVDERTPEVATEVIEVKAPTPVALSELGKVGATAREGNPEPTTLSEMNAQSGDPDLSFLE